MTDVWIVLIKDRHADVDALPFSTEDGAVAAARGWVAKLPLDPEDVRESELTPYMRSDGWVLYLPYGPEGDSVRVVKRQMDGEQR